VCLNILNKSSCIATDPILALAQRLDDDICSCVRTCIDIFTIRILFGGFVFYFDVNSGKWLPIGETVEYKNRRKILRDLWIIVAFLMLLVPAPYAFIIALVATFLSFMFLDAVQYFFISQE